MKPIILSFLSIAVAACLLFSCSKKYEDRLEQQNRSSGILRVGRKGETNIAGAKIDETVTLYAKIGEPDATVKIYVGGVEATVLTHGSANTTVRSESGSQQITVLMDTFNITIPAAAKIGPGILYFTLNDVPKPALAFEVYRPDILIPGQSFVEPFLFTVMDSTLIDNNYQYTMPRRLKDGLRGEAVVNRVLGLTYDEVSQTFYFMDQQPDDLTYRIRKLYNGVVTTIAGGGDNYMATTGSQLKLVEKKDLQAGPDGKIYFTSIFYTDADPATGFQSSYALIQRLNPATGAIEIVLGGGRSIVKYPSRSMDDYRGVEDGPVDSAMIYYPQSLTFDKEGSLYFMDGAIDHAEAGTLLRKFSHGRLETLLGKGQKDVYDFEDIDGVTYSVPFYTGIEEHTDGFNEEVRLTGTKGMVLAGNGKFYLLCEGGGWQMNVVEVNLDTREAATIIGLPTGQYSSITTGTFKEVALNYATTFDLDFDGNILFGQNILYKMNLKQETIAKVAGGYTGGGSLSDRELMQTKQKGENAFMGTIDTIVFDQFGNLYAGYSSIIPSGDVKMSKITIEE
ncbi:hypothetical protein SAMN05421788_10695 [Filimonas lacunae]|uniref:Uncharacterized protein n=1 Tax=Filimonas lacunae TaxID=477680 RepID=A0A173MEJ2_9BACT|nr:hypothetical protein [Filimonas lacunae]BAV06023.1 hypothetical protein FLA_2038 [Filimonas lacunae]SIT24254.1 hypothetical protein SAMN05421788_10695 [Filimonas lacunae]